MPGKGGLDPRGYGAIVILEKAEIMLDSIYEFAHLAIMVRLEGRSGSQWILDRITFPVKK